MSAKELSRELREGEGSHLRRRRWIVGMGLAAAGSMGVITLYQMGLIRHLPEPPLPGLDADEIDAAPEAYERLSMPDAALGLSSYAVTVSLATMGGEGRAQERPWLPLLVMGKVSVDAAQAGKLTWKQWSKHRSFCSWCLAAAAATFVTVPLAWPEAREALQHLDGDRESKPGEVERHRSRRVASQRPEALR